MDEYYPGKIIKQYKYRGDDYMLCEGTDGNKYNLWKRTNTYPHWWMINSNNNKSKCRAC